MGPTGGQDRDGGWGDEGCGMRDEVRGGNPRDVSSGEKSIPRVLAFYPLPSSLIPHPSHNDSRNLISAARALADRPRTASRDFFASPPCHRTASIKPRARPSCRK